MRVRVRARVRVRVCVCEFVYKESVDNKSSLVQIMARRQTGDKLLPWPMMMHSTDVSYTCVTQTLMH